MRVLITMLILTFTWSCMAETEISTYDKPKGKVTIEACFDDGTCETMEMDRKAFNEDEKKRDREISAWFKQVIKERKDHGLPWR